MLKDERLWQITQLLTQNQRVINQDLAELFHVNVATIRLDLEELEVRGVARRVYGGAVLASPTQSSAPLEIAEPPFTERANLRMQEKAAIGKAAAALIEDGDTIMIDGGSTTYQVVRNIGEKRGLTIISCMAYGLWHELVRKMDVQIFLTGGYLRPASLSLVGDFSETMLKNFRASKAILGIDAISAGNGYTAVNFLEATIKKRMIENSEELIFVADYTKFGRVSPFPVAALERAKYFVTDCKAPPALLDCLRDKGVNVITVQCEETNGRLDGGG